MGGSVSIHSPCTPEHNEFKDLFQDKKAMAKLFAEIASYGHEDRKEDVSQTAISHLDIKDKICLSEIIFFINRDANPIFAKCLTKNTAVIKEAFKFAIGPKSSKNYTTYEMGKKSFRKLLPALLLFTELYNIFATADSSIDDDKIFPNEYRKSRHTICNIPGVTVNAVSEEDWEKEFKTIDKNKNGYITFGEFCKYSLAKIITPSFYIDEVCRKVDDELEVIDTVGNQVVEAAILHTVSNVSLMSNKSQKSSNDVVKSCSALKEDQSPRSGATSEAVDTDEDEKMLMSRLARETSSTCVGDVLSKSISSLQNTIKNEDDENAPVNQTKVEESGTDRCGVTQDQKSLLSQLAREASSKCVSVAISQSISSIQQPKNVIS